MALTIAPGVNTVVGATRMTVTNITLDDTYIDDGYALVAADVGLNVIDNAIVYASQGYSVEWAADLLVVYNAAGVQETAAVDLALVTCTILAFGT